MTDILVWALFGSVVIAALPLQLLGLPGTWLLAADALVLWWLKGPGYIDFKTVIILAFMAFLAEILEFLTAVRGARSGPLIGGAGAAAVVGAFAGGLFGAPILFGLGAIPGMAIGAWSAVFTLALVRGSTITEASRAALGAMAGRIKGAALKLIAAAAMVAVIITSLVF